MLLFLQQFYFSDSSLQLLCSELKRLNFSRILCVGTPRFDSLIFRNNLVKIVRGSYRLHCALCKTDDMLSLLLDIDHRYVSLIMKVSFSYSVIHCLSLLLSHTYTTRIYRLNFILLNPFSVTTCSTASSTAVLVKRFARNF